MSQRSSVVCSSCHGTSFRRDRTGFMFCLTCGTQYAEFTQELLDMDTQMISSRRAVRIRQKSSKSGKDRRSLAIEDLVQRVGSSKIRKRMMERKFGTLEEGWTKRQLTLGLFKRMQDKLISVIKKFQSMEMVSDGTMIHARAVWEDFVKCAAIGQLKVSTNHVLGITYAAAFLAGEYIPLRKMVSLVRAGVVQIDFTSVGEDIDPRVGVLRTSRALEFRSMQQTVKELFKKTKNLELSFLVSPFSALKNGIDIRCKRVWIALRNIIQDVCPNLGISCKSGLRIGHQFPSFLANFLVHKRLHADGSVEGRAHSLNLDGSGREDEEDEDEDEDDDDNGFNDQSSLFANAPLEELFVSYLVLISQITRVPLTFASCDDDEQIGEHSLDVLRALGFDPNGEDGGEGESAVDDHDQWKKGWIPVWDMVDRSPVAVRHDILSPGKPIFRFLRMGIRPLATFASVKVLHQQRLLIRESFAGHDGLTAPLVTSVLTIEEKKKKKKKSQHRKEHGFSRHDRIEKSRFALPFFSFHVDGPVYGEVAYLLWKQIQTAYFNEQSVINRIGSMIKRLERVLWDSIEKERRREKPTQSSS